LTWRRIILKCLFATFPIQRTTAVAFNVGEIALQGAILVSRRAISAGWNILKFCFAFKTKNYICHFGTKLFDALATKHGS